MLYKPGNSPFWRYDFTLKGLRYSASTRTENKASAKRIEAAAREAALNPTTKRETLTLDEAALIYSERAERQPSWNNTKRTIAVMLKLLGANRLISEITHRDLAAAVAKRRVGLSDASVNREIETWRALWRHVEAQDVDIGKMPKWKLLLLAVPKQAPKSFSAAQEAALFTHLRADLHDFAAFALASGWRVSEVIALRWSDIDFGARMARTRIKGGDTIERPLSTAMLALIASQPRICPQVFTYEAQASRSAHKAKDGRKRAARKAGDRYPLSKSGWAKPWRAALKAAGIEGLCFHTLRHTRGRRMTAAGSPLQTVGKALGHKSLATTMRYASASADDVRAGLDASEKIDKTTQLDVAIGHRRA